MSENRYYWLKLKDDFFTSKRIKKLRNLAGGDTLTIIYLKMQLKSIKKLEERVIILRKDAEYTVSPLHINEFLFECTHKFSLFISSTLLRYPTNTIDYTVLCCNRFIILFM